MIFRGLRPRLASVRNPLARRPAGPRKNYILCMIFNRPYEIRLHIPSGTTELRQPGLKADISRLRFRRAAA